MLATLVALGAPQHILVEGKPHLGTDRLVRLLRAFRQHLQHLGVCQWACALVPLIETMSCRRSSTDLVRHPLVHITEPNVSSAASCSPFSGHVTIDQSPTDMIIPKILLDTG